MASVLPLLSKSSTSDPEGQGGNVDSLLTRASGACGAQASSPSLQGRTENGKAALRPNSPQPAQD